MGDPASCRILCVLSQAVMAIMDNPHPLETLGDSGAYGPEGSISRYHNPDHYTRVRVLCKSGVSSVGTQHWHTIDFTITTDPARLLMTVPALPALFSCFTRHSIVTNLKA